MTSELPLLWQATEKANYSVNAGSKVAISILEHYLQGNGIQLVRSGETDKDMRLDVVSDPLPPILSMSIGMAIHMLRNALDTATTTLLEKAGSTGSSRIGFPMNKTEAGLRATFEGGEHQCSICEHVTIKKGSNAKIRSLIPEFEELLFSKFRPWEDGNHLLWSLGRLDNINKHRMIIPTFAEVSWKGSWSATSQAGGISANFDCAYRLSPGENINLAINQRSIDVYDPGKFFAHLVFSGDMPLSGAPVMKIISEMTEQVIGIIETLEAKFN